MRALAYFPLILLISLTPAACTGCKSDQEVIHDREAAEAQERIRLQAEQLARNQDAIKRVIHEASLTGDQDVSSHVDALRSIIISDCPSDFQKVFNQYVRAWDESVQVRTAKEKVDADAQNAAVVGALATWFGSSATPWSDHVAAENKLAEYQNIANSDIHASYEDMRDIAAKYGLQMR